MSLERWIRRLASLLHRSRREAELDEEIRFHLDAAATRYRERGYSQEEARRAARLDFGGVDRVKEEVRDAWSFAAVRAIARDARFALRAFRKRPAYALTVITTLALAIGAAGAIFASLWAIVLRPLPYAHDDRLAVLDFTRRDSADRVGLSPLEVHDFRAASRTLSGLAEYHVMNFTLLGHGEPRRVRTEVVSPNYFSLLGVEPILGRDFVASDDSGTARPVLLLSHRFWLERLGGDPAIVGSDFTMNDRTHTVIGVLPPLPAAPGDIDVYMPVSACPFRSGERWSNDRSMRGLGVVVRLGDGVELARATGELVGITQGFAKSYPADYPESAGLKPELVPVRQAMTAEARPTLWVLSGAAAAILLLVLANLINLTLAQLGRREAELAMRTALGGSRGRLARQLVTEGCVLSLTGGGLGLVVTLAGRRLLASFLGRLTPRAAEIRLDAATVGLVLGLSLAVGVVLGLLPAIKRRTDVSARLRCDAPTMTAGGHRSRFRDALVVLQVAASFVLLVASGLLLRSLWNLERVAPGYAHPEVLAIDLPMNWTKYAETEDQVAFKTRLLDRVRSLPGIEHVAFADTYPLDTALPWNRRVAVGHAPPPVSEPGPEADFRIVSGDYFETVGVPLVEGRLFSDAERDESHPVAVVNQAFVRLLFPDVDPLGREVTFSMGDAAWTIVGVVGDVRQRALGEAPEPELYAPMVVNGGGQRLLVRGHAVWTLVPSLRKAIRAVDSEQPIGRIQTLEEARAEALSVPRVTATLLALSALVALFIAAAGLAGLLAYTLGERQREFGIRLAFGATRADIARLVVGRTGGLVGLGALLGIGSALFVSRGLGAMLFGLSASDPSTYALVAAALVATASLASLPSLWRALATAPSLALRSL